MQLFVEEAKELKEEDILGSSDPYCKIIGQLVIMVLVLVNRYLLSPVRLSSVCLSSVVCNVRAPYSGGSNFRQYFYGIRYLGHPLTSTENFTEIVPREPLRRGS